VGPNPVGSMGEEGSDTEPWRIKPKVPPTTNRTAVSVESTNESRLTVVSPAQSNPAVTTRNTAANSSTGNPSIRGQRRAAVRNTGTAPKTTAPVKKFEASSPQTRPHSRATRSAIPASDRDRSAIRMKIEANAPPSTKMTNQAHRAWFPSRV